VHYANANYYQINTLEDVNKVNATFEKFKTRNVYNFLDRDGTINKWDINIYEHMLFTPVNNLLDKLDNEDCVIITNQPDKVKFTATLADINRMTWEARQHLIDHGKNVIFSMSCIHRDVPKTGDVYDVLRFACDCRKPEIGMLEKASKRISISENSIFYGDSDCDEECAKNFGLQFIKMYN
jgi:HAD superfamily hydrolase (TIGR01662 family)